MNYTNTALNFTGNKYNLLGQILPKMDYSKKYFVDLFAGSGVVGFNVVDKYDKILENDIIEDLIDIHKQLVNNPYPFIERVQSLVVTKEDQDGFNKLRSEYNKNKSSDKLYALMLCSTNNMMRFNQKFEYNQTFGRRTFNPKTTEKLNKFIKHIINYKNKIYFSSNPFYKIKIYQPSMVYIDPPYGYIIDENGNMGNKQISEAGYNAFYKKEDDKKLYEYILELNKNKHSFMISGLLEHNNKKSWIMNKLIQDGFNSIKLDFNYNGVSRKGNKKSIEIIIMNY